MKAIGLALLGFVALPFLIALYVLSFICVASLATGEWIVSEIRQGG